jgi:nucleosome-remodeling factor subunit BPTF
LAAEEQSNLLSEIHIALLRSIIRAEEKDNTTFAPLDQKDSVNCLFFFMDSLTWPDCLRSFLSADPVVNAEPLQVL